MLHAWKFFFCSALTEMVYVASFVPQTFPPYDADNVHTNLLFFLEYGVPIFSHCIIYALEYFEILVGSKALGFHYLEYPKF